MNIWSSFYNIAYVVDDCLSSYYCLFEGGLDDVRPDVLDLEGGRYAAGPRGPGLIQHNMIIV